MTESEATLILEEVDDFRLCDRVFCAASDLTDNKVDFESESEPLKTVSMIWLATGVIENGGFCYLLEYKCGNDREMRLIADAFNRIEARTCNAAFEWLFSQFPGSTIIDDYDLKFKHYESIPVDTRRAIDTQFYSESERISNLLAQFIRANRKSIIRELVRSKKG